MSTERLSVDDILNKHDDKVLVYYKKARSAMEEYAAQEVEHKTKQLQEERADILESLFCIRDMVNGTPWAVVNKLIDQLNKKNEE